MHLVIGIVQPRCFGPRRSSVAHPLPESGEDEPAAANREEAKAALEAFEAKWGGATRRSAPRGGTTGGGSYLPRLPARGQEGHLHDHEIESMNSTMRKFLHYRGHFPNDESVTKVLYLALADLEKKWERSIRDWSNVLGQFAVFFKDRLPNL